MNRVAILAALLAGVTLSSVEQVFFAALLLLGLVVSIAAEAACPEIPPVARTPSTGSPFAVDNRGVTRLDTQTSDNVRITGGASTYQICKLTALAQ